MNDRRIESFDELQTFATIVESGSLAAAARILGVTPNAVSRRLSVLEDRLGHRLIHRTTRRLSITDAGERLLVRARRILHEVSEAERELDDTDGLSGTLRMGIHADMVGPHLMAGLAALLAREPALSLQLRVANHFIDPVRAGLDLSVYVGKPPESSLVAVRLPKLVWGLAAAPSYVGCNGQPTTPDQLINHECLRVIRGGPESHWKLSQGTKRGRRFKVDGRFETDDAGSLGEALYAGIGIGVRLQSEIDSSVRAQTLVHVLPEWRWASTPMYALFPAGSSKLPAARAVLDVLRNTTDRLA